VAENAELVLTEAIVLVGKGVCKKSFNPAPHPPPPPIFLC
jgi:hypothetical protein